MKKKFDLTTVFNTDRPMSWSAISSFEWNPKQWHDKYVIHGKCLRDDPEKGICAMCVVAGFADPECPVVKKTIELVFGSMVDKKIQDDPTYLPHVVRYPILQHEMSMTFENIPMIGFADTYREEWSEGPYDFHESPALRDYKTGRKPWTQKRADETGQLTLYAFFLYKMEKIRPEDVEFYIDWLPTHIKDGQIEFLNEGEVVTFRTKRTMQDVLEFGSRIKRTWALMEEFATRYENGVTSNMGEW